MPYSRGRLTRVDDLAVSTRFTYNALGRSGIPRFLVMVHNRLTYNARGQRTQMQSANGVTATWTYDATTFRLSQAQAANGATALQNLSYAYDAGGLITGITDSLWTGTRTFAYDPLGRLLSASGPFGPLSGGLPAETAQTYSYDATGNILSRAGITYTYADPLHPAAVTALSTGSDYSYDAAGNMLTGAGRALSWDADSRLAAVTVDGGNTATFAYDYTGQRVRKQTQSATLRYPFAGYEEDSTGVRTKYLFLGLERVALKRATGQTSLTFWYHNDHLGGVNVITDAAGARVQLAEYSPWGWITRAEGTVDLTHRFNGKERDPETGLYYDGGRYYDPHLGRFITADPFVPSPGTPQSLNRYAYTLNDPVNHLDPSGYFFSKLWKSLKKWVSGHKTVSLLLGSLLRFSPFPEMRLAGAAILFQSDTGRHILAGEVIAGTAAATFYCGGCGAAVGALTGEVLGGISAARSGGDVLSGVLFGGAVGAATGYLASGIGPTDPGVTPSIGEEFMRGFVRGVGSGAADSFAGGRGTANSILLGAAFGGLQGGALHAAYSAFVTFEVTGEPGGEAIPKEGLPTDMPVRGAVNVGFSRAVPGSCPTCEGSPLSMVLNQAWGFNAISGMHDAIIARAAGVLQSAGAQGLAQGFLNYPMMLPAGALTYDALLGGVPPSAFGLDER